jgi:ribosome biogenesis GTPase / thiamine phosphate phosphatase
VYLHALGWNSHFQSLWDAESREGLVPARVIEEQRDSYRIAGDHGEMSAEATGHLRHVAIDRSGLPAVGDWVAAKVIEAEGKAFIHSILPRRSKLSRKEAGRRAVEQILVANVDTVFLMMSLNADLNPRRIERYLGTLWESGAVPVIVLSKADLCSDPSSAVSDIGGAAPGVEILVLSSTTGVGVETLQPYLGRGNTVVLLGSSGVGKSTLINLLLNAEVQKTLNVRVGDDRGRHATTYRRLFPLPAGGALIDTPGMREFQLWEAGGLNDAFEEVGQLAVSCRYRDCTHQTEPGCAVKQAVEDGVMEPERLSSFHKLKRELEYNDRRKDAAAQSELKKRWKRIHKAMRDAQEKLEEGF